MLFTGMYYLQANSNMARASRNGSTRAIGLLLNFYTNINVFAKNEKGESAIDLAPNEEIKEMIEGLYLWFLLC